MADFGKKLLRGIFITVFMFFENAGNGKKGKGFTRLIGGVAVTLMLLGGCLLLPTTTWASSIWSSSFMQVYAAVGYVSDAFFVECDTGYISSVASCATGTISDGFDRSGSASGFADLATGDLTVSAIAAGGPQAFAYAKFGETLYFQGGTPEQFGLITMTATGSGAGGSNTASAGLMADFLVGGTLAQNAIGADTARPVDFCSGGAIGTQGCSSSDGQNLSVSVSFPLAPEGVWFVFGLV